MTRIGLSFAIVALASAGCGTVSVRFDVRTPEGATRQATGSPGRSPAGRTASAPSPRTPTPGPARVAREDGRYALEVPSGYRLYEDETPSVDGVIAPTPGTLSLASPSGFVLTVRHISLADTGVALEAFIRQGGYACGVDPAQGVEVQIAGERALSFEDTLCSPHFGKTFFYFLHGPFAYELGVESNAPYRLIEEEVAGVLATFEILDRP